MARHFLDEGDENTDFLGRGGQLRDRFHGVLYVIGEPLHRRDTRVELFPVLAGDAAQARVPLGAVARTALELSGLRDETIGVGGQLADDVQDSVKAIAELATASEEIGVFVTFVQKMARQSKLLALNAAMEAARAGEHGHGFAVVADEVRRLAAAAADSARRTDRVVKAVLERIELSQISARRSEASAAGLLDAIRHAVASFAQVERGVAEADEWTDVVAKGSVASHALVAAMKERLDGLARGTESFAAAMQQAAGSSEEQSASTQEIAAAARALADAADRTSRAATAVRTSAADTASFPVVTVADEREPVEAEA
ncbi:MAG: hypothetical protein NVS9B3_13560 [Gemmatimonadaceae bacterium]